jgi:hypothetical protein
VLAVLHPGASGAAPPVSVQAREWARGRVPKWLSALLFAIADYADQHGVAWVGQHKLADDLSCARRTVTRELGELEALGLLRRVRAHDDAGHRTDNYIVLAPAAADRGNLADAGDAYPSEVAELARAYVTTLSPSRPAQSLSDKNGRLSDSLSDKNGRLSDNGSTRTFNVLKNERQRTAAPGGAIDVDEPDGPRGAARPVAAMMSSVVSSVKKETAPAHPSMTEVELPPGPWRDKLLRFERERWLARVRDEGERERLARRARDREQGERVLGELLGRPITDLTDADLLAAFATSEAAAA